MITNPDGVSGKKLLGYYLIYLWRFSPGLRTANIFTSFPQSFFFFFLSTLQLVISYFPDRGLNLAPAVKAPSPDHWSTREFPLSLF